MPKTTLCWITVVRLPQPLQLVGLTNTNQTYVCIYVCVMCVHDILNPLFVLLQLHETLLPFEKLTSRYAVCFQCNAICDFLLFGILNMENISNEKMYHFKKCNVKCFQLGKDLDCRRLIQHPGLFYYETMLL